MNSRLFFLSFVILVLCHPEQGDVNKVTVNRCPVDTFTTFIPGRMLTMDQWTKTMTAVVTSFHGGCSLNCTFFSTISFDSFYFPELHGARRKNYCEVYWSSDLFAEWAFYVLFIISSVTNLSDKQPLVQKAQNKLFLHCHVIDLEIDVHSQ